MALGRRELLALAAAGTAAAAAGALVGLLGLRSRRGASALLDYSFRDLDGRETMLRDLPGRLLLCNFWATWCEPCREEVPLLIAARQQFAANGLEIAGIGIDQADKLRVFGKQYRINYPILVAGGDSGELLRALGDDAAALPYSVLLDTRRRIAYEKLGAWSKQELEREIRSAIG